MVLAGVGLIAYGTMFLIRNFYGFIELGITAELIGTILAHNTIRRS
ncbi:MAG TPA: hypothetical protein VKE41_03610 [Roseiflexaceae bacterium]|nr:hypothetical protein [Roseiflexaceae bacterium]